MLITFFLAGFFLHGNGVSHVTVIGPIHSARSLGSHAISFANCLRNNLSVSIITSSSSDFRDVPEYIRSMTLAPQKIFTIESPVVIYVDSLIINFFNDYARLNFPGLRIAFAWADYDMLLKEKVKKLNEHFDLILVGDKCLIEIFKKSGVKLPIYVLPLSLDLQPFLSISGRANCRSLKSNEPFVFGCSAGFEKRKNLDLLLQAFAQEFGNDQKVRLKIHGRWGNSSSLKNYIKRFKLTNVDITEGAVSRAECVKFFASLDCYVLVSKAEGFSITPREALASGIPCILSNNTAHKTICETGFVYAVSCKKSKFSDVQFDCEVCDVQKALRNVYTNYNEHYMRAQKGREWVKQYLSENLEKKYLSVIQPKKIILGDRNILTDAELVTNSLSLFEKYKILLAKQGDKLRSMDQC